MPMTKEEHAEYKKQYRIDNAEKIKEHRKQYRIDNLEKIKAYDQTPQRKKTNRISKWKSQGMEHDDFDYVYDIFMNTTNCDACNIELTTDRQNTSTTKCLDHDHSNGEIRYVLCHSCNTNDNSRNTSGTPNIYKHINGYTYQKMKNKITHSKWFKTKEDAIAYKEQYESQVSRF